MAKVIIIGSGPAGVSAALYTARAGLDTTIIASGIGSLEKAHEIQNYYGIQASGRELALAGIEGAKQVGVSFINEEVVAISHPDSFIVQTSANQYTADYVVIATGSSRNTPNIRNLKALEGMGVSYCAICDAFFYRGRAVAVVGNGDFAVHEIGDLLPVAGTVTLLTNGEELKATVPDGVAVDTRTIRELNGSIFLEGVTFEDGETLAVDGLFVAYGVAGSTSFAKKIGALLNGNSIAVNENMETNVPGLYAAGDCTGGLLQVAKAVYEGAVAGTHIAKVSRTADK